MHAWALGSREGGLSADSQPWGGGAARAKGFELLLKRPEALGQSEGPPSEMSLGWGGAARGQRGWRLSPWGWVAGWCC